MRIFTSRRSFERELSEYLLNIGKFLRNSDMSTKFKKSDWRGENLLQITQEFNNEVFRHIYWFPNAFAESLNQFFL